MYAVAVQGRGWHVYRNHLPSVPQLMQWERRGRIQQTMKKRGSAAGTKRRGLREVMLSVSMTINHHTTAEYVST